MDGAAVQEFHDLKHEAEFRYDPPIVEALEQLAKVAFDFHWTNRQMERGPQNHPREVWLKFSEDNHKALMDLLAFERGMVDRFRDHLRL